MSRPFRFKQFNIVQENAAMKVGTDSVLLGSWAPSTNPKRILDIGTGTGILALMLAQRFSRAELIAVELDRDALVDAEFNVAHSNWSERISVLQGDFMDLSFSNHFDLILSNPPYFPADTFSPVAKRSLATKRKGKHCFFLAFESK